MYSGVEQHINDLLTVQLHLLAQANHVIDRYRDDDADWSAQDKSWFDQLHEEIRRLGKQRTYWEAQVGYANHLKQQPTPLPLPRSQEPAPRRYFSRQAKPRNGTTKHPQVHGQALIFPKIRMRLEFEEPQLPVPVTETDDDSDGTHLLSRDVTNREWYYLRQYPMIRRANSRRYEGFRPR